MQKLKLSPAAKIALKGRINELEVYGNQALFSKAVSSVPVRVNLGMNGTPVLDQGYHGSCVTFAMTGALDAAIGKGDYVSQLCSLQLGNTLLGHANSGWDGSWGDVVLEQLNNNGIITKGYQLKYGCPAGMKKYPLTSNAGITKKMSATTYKANSHFLTSGTTLVSPNTAFNANFSATSLFNQVKQQLRAKKRVVVGFLLDDEQGDAGAVGTYKKHFDTWALTPSIVKKAKAGTLYAGHEIIIIGYDDLASSSGGDGSKGVFIIRNSWGPDAGDNGNYYMTFNYFKYLVDEAAIVFKK